MGTAHSITLKNTTIHGINNAMDRKNINRGFKKLRLWQDAVSLYVMACKIFGNFAFELKKVAAKIHGEIVTIDPKSLEPNTEVMRF